MSERLWYNTWSIMKHFFDFLLAFILIILFLPIYIVVALLIWWQMGRPVLFRQERPGYKEKIFGIYKFRTMTNEKDENGNLLPDIEYLPLYNKRQKKRHDVKPGITGWAQVNGRNAISWKQKFEYDVWYVEHQSFWLDMKILWRTFLKVVKRSDISSDTHVTMEKFTGNRK